MLARLADHFEEVLIGVALAVMVVINFANIVSRYLLHASIAPSEEILVGLFVWASFLGVAVGAKRGAHLGLSLVTDRLPPGLRRLSLVFSTLCAVVFVGLAAYYGALMVASEYGYGQTSPALGLPAWIFGLALPTGAAFTALRFLQGAVAQWQEVGR